MPNGNTVIGWGGVSADVPQVTEVDAAGNIVYELTIGHFPSDDVRVTTYRAVKGSVFTESARPFLGGTSLPDNVYRLHFAKFQDEDVTGYRIYYGEFENSLDHFWDTDTTSISLPDFAEETGIVSPLPSLYLRVTALYADNSESQPSQMLVVPVEFLDVPEGSNVELPNLGQSCAAGQTLSTRRPKSICL